MKAVANIECRCKDEDEDDDTDMLRLCGGTGQEPRLACVIRRRRGHWPEPSSQEPDRCTTD